MIWGLSIQPGDDFTITLGEELCISLAAIESRFKFEHAGSYSQLILKTETCEHLLCTLVQGTIFQQCLKLKLMPGEKVTFTVQGSCCIYVTGYSYSSPDGPANGEETVTEEDTANDGNRNDCNVEVKSQPEDDDCSNDGSGDEETLANLILAAGRQQATSRCSSLLDEGIVHEGQDEWVPDDSSCVMDNSKDKETISDNPLESADGLNQVASTCSSLSGEGIVHEGQDESVPDDSSCVMNNSKDKETISDNPLESADGLNQVASTCSSLSGEGIVHEGQDESVPDDSSCVMNNSKDKETISDNPLESADGLNQATSTCSSLLDEGIVHEGQDESVPDDSSCIMDNSKDKETISDNPLESADGLNQATSTCSSLLDEGIVHGGQDESVPDDSSCIMDNSKDKEAISDNLLESADGLKQATSTCSSLLDKGIVHEGQDESVPDDSSCIMDNSKDKETISDNLLESADGLNQATSTCSSLLDEGIVHEGQDESVADDSSCVIDNSKDKETINDNPLESADGLKQATSTCSSLLDEGIVREVQDESVPDDSSCVIDNSKDKETISDNPLESADGLNQVEGSEMNSCPEKEFHGERTDNLSGIKGITRTESLQQVNEVIDNDITNLRIVTPKQVQERIPLVDKGCHQQLSSASCISNECVEGDHTARQCMVGVVSCSNSGVPFEGKECKEMLNLAITVPKYKRNHKGNILRPKADLVINEKTHTGKKPFKCTHCRKKFNQKGSLKIHERIHTGEKPFQCEHCEKTFTQKGHLTSHERIHVGKKPFECNHFGKTFLQKANLASHGRSHCVKKFFKCKYCRKQFHSMANYTIHERIHTVKKPLKCQYCEKTFTFKYHLTSHERIHTGEKPFKCKFCRKEFRLKANCTNHERIHTGEKPYKCKYCRKQFPSVSQCIVHERVHTAEKPYICKHCGKKFSQSAPLKYHERIHSGEKPFKCKFCRKEFRSKANCANHERIHTGERPYKCKYCRKQFPAGSQCIVHERVHTAEKPFICKHCGKKFSQSSALKCHEMIHTGEKPFKCNYCEKTFTLKQTLRSHERIHTGKTPFSCKHCGKKFCQSSGLKYHEKIHSGEKPFKCKYCRKQFHSKGNCTVHEKSHTGENHFICNTCGRKFNNRDYYAKHQRIHTGENTFNCNFCEEMFHSRANLKDHQRTQASETTINKDNCGQIFSKKLLVTLRKIPVEASFKCKFCAKEFYVKRDLNDHELLHRS